MFSGRRPFKGESAAETMHAILTADPMELLETNQSVPPALERIVRRCLESGRSSASIRPTISPLPSRHYPDHQTGRGLPSRAARLDAGAPSPLLLWYSSASASASLPTGCCEQHAQLNPLPTDD
jgi:hypothetical protein